jgi:hypothetical protein
MWVQLEIGNATLVEVRTKYCPPETGFVPLISKFVPLTTPRVPLVKSDLRSMNGSEKKKSLRAK